MIRYEEKMSKIYGLGRPCSGRSTRTLRLFLSYDSCIPLEVPESLGGRWSYYKSLDGRELKLNDRKDTFENAFILHKPFDERELKLYDREDTFKNAFTLLPYMPLDECRSVVEKSPRWQLAIDAGLEVQFLEPDPEIFQRQCFATATTLIIATPLRNWGMLNEYLRKCIEIERSIEDLRKNGKELLDYIKLLRKTGW